MTNEQEQSADQAARLAVLKRLDVIRRLEDLIEQPAVIWTGNHRHNDLHLPFEHYETLLYLAAHSLAALTAIQHETGKDIPDEILARAQSAVRQITEG
jgi:hypothetical protein